MLNTLLEVLIPILSTILAALAGVVVYLCKRYQRIKTEKDEAQKRNEQYRELCNYTYGIIDTVLNDNVTIRPDLKKSLERGSKRYHKLDIIKEGD